MEDGVPLSPLEIVAETQDKFGFTNAMHTSRFISLLKQKVEEKGVNKHDLSKIRESRKSATRRVTRLLSQVMDSDHEAVAIDALSHKPSLQNRLGNIKEAISTSSDEKTVEIPHIDRNNEPDPTSRGEIVKSCCGGIASRLVLLPNSLTLGLWDLFIAAFVLAQFVYAVMITCYSDQCFPTIGILVSGSIRLCINMTDFLVNARIAYFVPVPSSTEQPSEEADHSRSLNRKASRRMQFKNTLVESDRKEKITSKNRASMRQLSIFEQSRSTSDSVLITDFGSLLYDYVLSQGVVWFFIDLFVAVMPAELIFTAFFHHDSEYLERMPSNLRAKTVTQQIDDPSAPTTFLFILLLVPCLMKVTKLLVISRLSHSVSHTFSRFRVSGSAAENALSVLWLLVLVVIFAHTSACFFYLIARYETYFAHSGRDMSVESSSEHISWLHAQGIENEGFMPRFVSALYWSLVTLTSTGYGDITPVTFLEKGYNILICLLGALVYATIFGRVTTMFNSMNTMNDMYRKKLTQINRFMSVYGLPTELKQRIRKQVKFDWTLTSGLDVDSVISGLPYSMQVEVRRQILQDSLETMPLMQQIGKEAITALLMFMNVQQCISGTCIIKEGDPATQMFFVKRGRLAVLKDGKKIHTLKDGAIFGEVGLLLGLARTASIVAETRSVYFALAGDAYARIMCMHPEFHELLERRALARLQGAIHHDDRAASLVHKIAQTTITKTNNLVASELLIESAMAKADSMLTASEDEGKGAVADSVGKAKLNEGPAVISHPAGERSVGERSLSDADVSEVPENRLKSEKADQNIELLCNNLSLLMEKINGMETHLAHLIQMDKVNNTTERWRAWNT